MTSAMLDREVKLEVLSPPSTKSFPDSPEGSTSTKKLDPIDKWRTRVLFCGRAANAAGDDEETWSKKIEKQVAVLRVAFPFLTDRQIRGKAWQSCGFNSVMGAVPRQGLAPGVKREFMKHRSPYRSTISQRVKKEPLIKTEKMDKKFAFCPYTFASPNGQLLTPQNVVENLNSDSVFSSLSQSKEKGSPIDMENNMQTNSSTSAKKRKRRTSGKAKKAGKNVNIIPETPENSVRSTSPFCSQPLIPQMTTGLNTVIPSQAAESNCVTHISECSFTTPRNSFNKLQLDSDPTESGLNNITGETNSNSISYFCPDNTPTRCSRLADAKKKITFETAAEVYYSDSYVPNEKNDVTSKYLNTEDLQENVIRAASPIENLTNASEMCTPKNLHFLTQISRNTTNFSMDEQMDEDLINQDINKQISINSMDNHSLINTNPPQMTDASFDFNGQISELYLNDFKKNLENYQDQISIDYQEPESFTEEESISVSLPTTPQDFIKYSMPGSILLSNYSSEYNKAYAKKDLNPSTYRNYSKHRDKSLKNYFDRIISPNECLQAFFKAEDKSFTKIKKEVRHTVNNIILNLENESDEKD